MTSPNDRPRKDPAKTRPAPPAHVSAPIVPKPAPAAPTPAGPSSADVLASQVPTGEIGVRNEVDESIAGASGGTSKTEDTSRAAGYVADLTKTNEPPPGPPVEKSPEDFAGPESESVPPKPLPAPAKPASAIPPRRRTP